MLFQLIVRDVEWYQHAINALIVILGRSLDILSTRYVSKELKLETNKLARKIGWKGMLLLQIPIVVLGALDFYLSFFIFFWSLFLFANNMEGSWYVKEVSEEGYQRELKTHVKNSKIWRIILGELSNVITLTGAGVFILLFLFVFNDLFMVFFVALALICKGTVSTIRSILYLFDLKREESKEENQEDKLI